MKKVIVAVLVFAVLRSFAAFSMETDKPTPQEYSQEDLDNLYKEAISYRDNDDKTRAAELFLMLSYHCNPRAMHNYAMIKFENKEFDQAYYWFSTAAELGLSNSILNKKKMDQMVGFTPTVIDDHKKIVLYLVIGSNRKAHNLGCVFSVINDIKSSNNNYTMSFDGIATTMDLLSCEDKTAQHIVGNAETFCFKKYNIKAAYLERLPTFTDKSKLKNFDISDLFKRENNIIGNIINNISRSMDTGAPLEIELHPYFMTIPGLTSKDRQKFWKINPFHATFNLADVELLASQMQGATEEMENLGLMESQQEKISSLINLYVKQGVAEELKKNISIYNSNKSGFETIKKRFFDEFENLGFLYLDLKTNMATVQNLMENSVIGALMVDLAVLQNIPHIRTYLEENGFTNVTIERTTSKRNGRKNVWLVGANKL